MTPKPKLFDPNPFLSKVGEGRLLQEPGGFSQAERADAIFYIQKGKVKLTVVSNAGKEAVIAILGAGGRKPGEAEKPPRQTNQSLRVGQIKMPKWTKCSCQTQQFSPDGSRIAYTIPWDTWTVLVLGGEPRRMLPNAAGLIWIGPQQLLFSEIKSGLHMAIVSASESRTDGHDVYVPPHERLHNHGQPQPATCRSRHFAGSTPGK